MMSSTENPPDDLNSENAQRNIVLETQLIEEARELIIAGEQQKALSLVLRALNINENSVEALWLYARLIPEKEKEKAITVVKQLLVLKPDHEKGLALLKRLETELAENPSDMFSIPQPKPTDQVDLMKQMLQQQQAIIDQQRRQMLTPVQQTVNVTQVPMGYPAALQGARNESAFIVGLLIAIFLGMFGVSHMMNGKVGTGIALLIIGWLFWNIPSGVIITLTAGFGLCLLLPLHLLFAYLSANSGAKYY